MAYTNTAEGDIIITQGDSGLFVLEFKNQDGTPKDLTGLTATLSVAKTKVDDNGAISVGSALITKKCDPNTNPEGERHIVRFEFLPTDTDKVKVGEYEYDVELTDGGSFVWTPIVKSFTIEHQITRSI